MRGCVSKRGNKWSWVVEMGKSSEGKRRQKSKGGYDSKVDAEKALQKVLHELNTDTYIEPTKDDVATFFTSWLEQKRMVIRPGTYKTYRWLVNYHIIPQLGQHKMVNLSPQHLVSMYERLGNGEKRLSAQTINHVHKVLHDALNTAVKWELLVKNVSDVVKPPTIPKSETKTWTDEELMQFLEFTKNSRYHIIFLLAAQTRNGFPVSPYFLEARWLDLLRKSGLPKIRLHDLRHTHASLLLKVGIHPKAVSERLGHSSIMITLDRYSHLFPTLQQEAAEKLDELLTTAAATVNKA